MHTAIPSSARSKNAPWNKGRLIGPKRPLKPKDVWSIRVHETPEVRAGCLSWASPLQLEGRKRDLALFNLAIDSKLRGCDIVRLQVNDVCAGGRVRERSTAIQMKTGRPVLFEITQDTRASVQDWLSEVQLRNGCYLFPSRFRLKPHLPVFDAAGVRLRRPPLTPERLKPALA
jgi:integrase